MVIVSVAVVTIALDVPFAFASVAQQGYYQINGSCCSGAEMDGWRADISPSTMTPASGGCLITAVLAADNISPTYQLESGEAKCASGTSIDGTCSTSNDLTFFIEWSNSGTYSCYPKGDTLLNEINTIQVTETGNGVDPGGNCYANFNASINGTQYNAYNVDPNFCSTTAWVGMAWAEFSSANSCSSSNHLAASFTRIARWQYSTGVFQPVNSVTRQNYNGCISVTSYANQSFSASLN